MVTPNLPDKPTVAARAWGAQNNYRAELCAILAALHITPQDTALTIHSDALAAIKAINSMRQGTYRRLDAPANDLVFEIIHLLEVHTAPTYL